jgi:hypothetical protein
MTNTTKAIFTAVLLAGIAARAQQNSQPQIANTSGTKQEDPCTPASATETRAKTRMWNKLAGQIDAHAWQIAKGSHGAIDNNDVKGAAIDAASSASKPCVAKQSTNTTPTATSPPAPESKPVISEDGHHVYVCPGGSRRNPELPICELPDGHYLPMQELPIPPGLLTKGGTTAEAGAINSKQSATPLTDAKPNPNAVTSTPTH